MTISLTMARGQRLIVVWLLLTAVAAWALVAWRSTAMAGHGMGLTMGLGAPLFFVTWLAMMVAMMFPSAAPMVLMFARIAAGKREQGQPSVSVWVFVAGYIAVWWLAGLPAFAAAVGVDRLAAHSAWLTENSARFGGSAILAGGLYQLSPLKRTCLSACRTPMQFILTSWRDGVRGAFRMGLEHGVYCLGCCWTLMLLFFVVGVMSLPWMALLALVIFVEKNGRFAAATGTAIAGLLIAGGTLLILALA